MSKKKIFLKIVAFIIILLGVVILFSPILKKKYQYKADQAAMEIAQGFYAEPENSIDVLYLGQSYVRNGISPLEIWKNYGITGYSRASSQQIPAASYYLLEEAFQTQKPKAVVFEVATLVEAETSESNDYDVREAKIHEVIDYMKWSPQKIKLARDIVNNSNLSYLDLLFPLYRYHDRWSELTETDFEKVPVSKPYSYRGQYPGLTIDSFQIRDDYMAPGSKDEDAQLSTVTAEYVEKMQALCEENGAELILIRTTNVAWDENKHNIVESYANEHGLTFLDYCTQELRDEMGFNSATDTTDQGSHLNIIGAEKLSKHLGKFLVDNINFEDKRNKEEYQKWDEDYNLYLYEKLAKEVVKEGNLSNYLTLINKPNYIVFVASKNDTGLYFTDEIHEKMTALGLVSDLSEVFYSSYIGIANGGECLYEERSSEVLNYNTAICDHYVSMLSDARRGASSSVSIQIDGEELSKNAYGLNFVVYDQVLDRVIDAKTFNIGNTGILYTERNKFSTLNSFDSYFDEAMSDRYICVLSVKGSTGVSLPNMIDKLRRAGVQSDLQTESGRPYVAIWDSGELVFEEIGDEVSSLYVEENISDVSVTVESSCIPDNARAAIWINDEGSSMNQIGFNIAIYDKYMGKVVKSANFY